MTRFIQTLTEVATPDPDTRRRGRILITICLGIIVVLLTVGVGLTLLQPMPRRFVNLGLAVLVFASAGALARKGFVTAGAYVLIVLSILGTLSGLFLNPTSPFNLFYLLIGVLLSSILLPPNQIWIVLGMLIAGVLGASALVPEATRQAINLPLAIGHLTVLLVVSAFIAFIGALNLQRALREAESTRRQLETTNQQLSEMNATLEKRVTERTARLHQMVEEQRAMASRLAESLQAQQQLNQMFMAVATPVIPVSDETLVIPLIGNINEGRAHNLLTTALQALEEQQARVLILDVTGVAIVDTQVAEVLLQVARAARLMGAETILAGIRPELAQTLVSLGADLGNLRTAARLQTALSLIPNGKGEASR
ncbi:MAG: STAS domain-containing protein [Oscillochloridaceae bacterium]|nr:STAS domain-containing protein [Chloroflexaceae bacterium]MDW8391718.1 STAS domain-containing protein [Oscillochloridaceae bacterium]